MIYFARKPDAVFTEILNTAFDIAAYSLRKALELQPYETLFPTASRWLSAKKAVKELNWLQGLLSSPIVYRITEPAMQIVYDAVVLFVSSHNRQVNEAPLGESLQRLGPFMIGPIDMELLFDSYFWNEAFLEVIPEPGSRVRETERIDQPIWVDDPDALFQTGSTRYPDPRTPGDTRTRRDGPELSIPLPADLAEGLEDSRQRFREKFGRDPGPDDPLFWDPEVSTPMPLDPGKMRDQMVEVMRKARIDPAKIYAFEKTGMIPTTENIDAYGPDAMEEWRSAVREYEDLHGKQSKKRKGR